MSSGKFYLADPWLKPFYRIIEDRFNACISKERSLAGNGTLADFAMGHHYYGLHRDGNSWIFREWAPNATGICLIGTFNNWKETSRFSMKRINRYGDWEIILPAGAMNNGDLFKLSVCWQGGKGERLPSYANRLFQDENTKIFSAQVWVLATPFDWKIEQFKPRSSTPVVYEAHVGMATDEEKIGTYREFAEVVIPMIADAGYNTIQLMAIQEHPFYASFGYHVSSFFAPSSRFGTPEELKGLIDTAHEKGLRVIMDLVHSHSVRNTNEGLGLFDGSDSQFFHTGHRRFHVAWDSLCFDYGKDNVIHFLLSNCRYWLEEYKFDGFRFDGVTSMIYYDHGLGKNFTSYEDYFDGGQDIDALVYLFLANKMIHEFKPGAITIAEDMSGMPGLAASRPDRGYGFDYRLSMGVPDFWIKLVKEIPDENWNMSHLMHELTRHRLEEKVISYCESHDQALVGDKTLIFRMIDAEMYSGMNESYHSIAMDRGIALHKMIRLITFSTSGGGYLNFMGNEFGHPEWIDFPREGNNWSFKYARRQWNLLKNENLKYRYLAKFDRRMINLQHDFGVLDERIITRLIENDTDKVIAFTRGELLFVFNFDPVRSFTCYGIPIKGAYSVILDTDDPELGGFNRFDRNVIYYAVPNPGSNLLDIPFYLYLYLPSRTAMVLRRMPVRKATDI